MFQPDSRYHTLKTVKHRMSDGREVAYKRRRFVPRARDMNLLAEVEVTNGDRLDLLSARTLGDPEQFWRLCDANEAMNPFTLVARPGRRLRVAMPQLEEPT